MCDAHPSSFTLQLSSTGHQRPAEVADDKGADQDAGDGPQATGEVGLYQAEVQEEHDDDNGRAIDDLGGADLTNEELTIPT